VANRLNAMERFYPLKVKVCGNCFLVQLQEYVAAEEIFTEYAYFSSYADSYVAHARAFCHDMVGRVGLNANSKVVELASNDGYLLQHFVELGIPVLGVEPARNVARVAIARGVPTHVAFFGAAEAGRLAADGHRADLIVANNVLAQVPDLNSFVAGIAILLAPKGRATIEFPHLLNLMEKGLYDTIYHEHFSYFSLLSAEAIFDAHGLTVFDLDEIWTHGGSLRLHVGHKAENHPVDESVTRFRVREAKAGLHQLDAYKAFGRRCEESKWDLLAFLIEARRAGKRIVAYGAPGKGNTLLNYCGIRTDFLDYAVDRNPYKHGRFTPGTHIPIFPPERILETRPDYLLILPWNLRDEITESMAHIREWGGQFVIPIPRLTVHS
jgi:SAM-dependent methyltransferase